MIGIIARIAASVWVIMLALGSLTETNMYGQTVMESTFTNIVMRLAASVVVIALIWGLL